MPSKRWTQFTNEELTLVRLAFEAQLGSRNQESWPGTFSLLQEARGECIQRGMMPAPKIEASSTMLFGPVTASPSYVEISSAGVRGHSSGVLIFSTPSSRMTSGYLTSSRFGTPEK